MSEEVVVGVSGLVTDVATSYRMKRVRRSDTEPERIVRGILRGLGHHYRLRNADLPGSPDMANRLRRWAVFVHGCFWHGHEGCKRAALPERNRSFWEAKIRRNRLRDQRSAEQLERDGYRVVTIWECELSSEALVREEIVAVLGRPADEHGR